MSKRRKICLEDPNGLTLETFTTIAQYCTPYTMWAMANVCKAWRLLLQKCPRKLISRKCKNWILGRRRSMNTLVVFYNLWSVEVIDRPLYAKLVVALGSNVSEIASSLLRPLAIPATGTLPKASKKKRQYLSFCVPYFVDVLHSKNRIDMLYRTAAAMPSLLGMSMCNSLLFYFLRKFIHHPLAEVRDLVTLNQLVDAKLSSQLICKCWKTAAQKKIGKGLAHVGFAINAIKLPDLYASDFNYIKALQPICQVSNLQLYYERLLMHLVTRLVARCPDETEIVTFVQQQISTSPRRLDLVQSFISQYGDNLTDRNLRILLDKISGGWSTTESEQIIAVLLEVADENYACLTLMNYIKNNPKDWEYVPNWRIPKTLDYAWRNGWFEKIPKVYNETLRWHVPMFKQLCIVLGSIHRLYINTNDEAYNVEQYVEHHLLVSMEESFYGTFARRAIGWIYYPHRPPTQFLKWKRDESLWKKGDVAYNYLKLKYQDTDSSIELW